MKASAHFLWYDFWVGVFWDRNKRVLYVAPLPCCVLKFSFGYGCGACFSSGEMAHPTANGGTSYETCSVCRGTGELFG